MNTTNKDNGQTFLVLMTMACPGRNSFTPIILNCSFRWRWVIRFWMLQPLFHQTKNSCYHWI